MKEHSMFMARRTREYIERDPCPKWMTKEGVLVEKAEARRELYHYTNIDSLVKILASKYLKFSRTDLLNDPLEVIPLSVIDLYKRVFVACFTNEKKEKIYMWNMYTSKGMGIRIDWYFKEEEINSRFIDKNRPILDDSSRDIFCKTDEDRISEFQKHLGIKDVIYDDNAYKISGYMPEQKDGYCLLPDFFGQYKSEIWKIEEETRLVLSFLNVSSTVINTDYVLVPIDSTCLERVNIIFDPWMSKEMKNCLKTGLEGYLKDWGVDYDFPNSELCNRIR